MHKLLSTALLAAFTLAASSAVFAQGQTPPVPQVIATATGEATVIPDRASIILAVETRAQTASAAASQNARLQQTVIAAIVGKGVPGNQISTTGFTVYPNERHSPEGQRTLLGFIVRNSIVVNLERIDQVGPVLDAALTAGANVVSNLSMYSSKYEEARRTALQDAMRKAKADAEVLAVAAGATLGGVLEVQTTDGFGPRPMYDMAVASARAVQDTPIVAGEQKVTVSVTTRWALAPSR
jgi:hypothetical protein